MITLSSLTAGTVGANSDGRTMDKAFLDIYLGDDVNYQYVKYSANGFELESRKLNKVFDLYRQQGLKSAKFIINGKFELPSDVGKKATIVIKGKSPLHYIGGSYHGRKDTFINGNKFKYSKDDRMIVKVAKDNMGIPFINVKIEVLLKYFMNKNDLNILKQSVSSMKIYVNYQAKQLKRGDAPASKEVPLRAYIIED